MIDLNIHDLIVNLAEVGPDDVVLEVGPGAGALTSLMGGRGARVVAVELDPGMAQLTAEATAEMAGVRVLNVDALAGKHRIEPRVFEAVDAAREGGERPFKLVANLPYNVATPLIMNLLLDDAHRPSLLVVTIQKELGERLIAPPGSPQRGALSVLVQALAEVEIARTLPPSVFWPRPKVDSAVVAIRPDPAKRAEVGDLEWLGRLVRDVFLHRRQNLRRVLVDLGRDRWPKDEIPPLLQSLEIDGTLRAESLDAAQWIALSRGLKERF